MAKKISPLGRFCTPHSATYLCMYGGSSPRSDTQVPGSKDGIQTHALESIKKMISRKIWVAVKFQDFSGTHILRDINFLGSRIWFHVKSELQKNPEIFTLWIWIRLAALTYFPREREIYLGENSRGKGGAGNCGKNLPVVAKNWSKIVQNWSKYGLKFVSRKKN